MPSAPVRLQVFHDKPIKQAELELLINYSKDALKALKAEKLTPKRREQITQLQLILRLAREIERLQDW
jgi:hypothetical protein